MAQIAHDDQDAVVIIGSGAGGGTLAHELTRRGIKVVLLEAGGRQSLASFSQDPGEAFVQLTWLDPRTTSGTSTVREDYPNLPSWTAKTLGGTTVHWTGATPRIRPWEVRARTTYGDVAGASLIDWPIEYAELMRYYELAERRMVVTRRHGNPGLPASSHFKVMYNGARRIGYKQVHTGYLAINTGPADDRGMCIQQGFCVQGCKTGAKWSTLYTEIPRAEATGNLDLRIQSRAARIEHGENGRVSGVVYRDANGYGTAPAGAPGVCRLQQCRDCAFAAVVGIRSISSRARQFQRPGGTQLLPPHGGIHLGSLRQADSLLARHDSRRNRRG